MEMEKEESEREREKWKKGKEHVIGWGDLEEWTKLAKPLQDKSCDWDQGFCAGACPLVPLKQMKNNRVCVNGWQSNDSSVKC